MIAVYVLAAAVLVVADLFWLWVAYLAITHLERLRKQVGLTPAMQRLGTVAYYLSLAWDIRCNFSTFSLLMLHVPLEATVTGHLSRIKNGGAYWKWQERVARLVCTQLLDPGDPSGCHCRKE